MSELLRITTLSYAFRFIATWYSWGGDDPSGFDCSGFIVEVLKRDGFIKRGTDYTAAQLYTMFPKADKPQAGVLAFWKNSAGKIIHVEMCINKWQTIGASGGGRATLTKLDAVRDNAFIKERPIKEGVLFADPFLTQPQYAPFITH